MVATGYARTYQVQSILTASPGQLVLLLYDGALRFLAQAHVALETKENDPHRIEVIHRNLYQSIGWVAVRQIRPNENHGGARRRREDDQLSLIHI